MNILYIHQYFNTPEEPGGTRSYWISKELVRRGHCVTMITSTNKKLHSKPCEVIIEGIKVIYLKNEYSNYMSPFKKVQSFINFLNLAIDKGCKQKDVDMVFATSTPLTVGYVALRLKSRKKYPYVFEVRDLWPEFPIQIGAIKNPILIWLLRKFEKLIYEKSEHVIALSPGMQDGVISAGTPIEKTTMVPNMSKPDLFYPHEVNIGVANEFDIDTSKFNVIHFGAMGIANGLEYIIEAAKSVTDSGDEDINFIFMGSGATEPFLKRLAEQYRLTNVKFLGDHNMKTVIEVVNICDISITSFKNLPILATNSPNKLFDSLSAGKPIIVNSAGWTKNLVEQGDCGFFVDPENPTALAEKLIEVKEQKELLDRWSKNARKLAEEVYDKVKLSAQIADVLEDSFKNLNNKEA